VVAMLLHCTANFSHKIHQHTTCQLTAVKCAGAAPTSRFAWPSCLMLVLSMAGCWNVPRWSGIQWHYRSNIKKIGGSFLYNGWL